MTENQNTSVQRLMCLMFTDIVGSSSLKVTLGDAEYVQYIAKPHNAIFQALISRTPRAAIANYTGDGFLVTFDSVADAVNVALLFHQALAQHHWVRLPVTTRIGIHLGDTTLFSDATNTQHFLASHAADMCARLMSLGVGNQTLLTRAAFDSARQYVRLHPQHSENTSAPPLEWHAHGRYAFKGFEEPLEVFEVGVVGTAPLSPPLDSDKVKRALNIDEQATLGWRPAIGLSIPRRDAWYLHEKLGEGGFGEVWLAQHVRTKSHRVFKFCFDSDRLRSFKRELTLFKLISAGLGQRDDIVPLLDVQVEVSPYFLESEYIPGGNLRQWASRQGDLCAIPIERRLDLIIALCHAVAAAHSLGIVHKDIKPSNVFVEEDPDGTLRPRLADFGIGHLSDTTVLAKHLITETGFTESLFLGNDSSRTGTRLYAPPESHIGTPASSAGDIYALGVLLYQLVIGDLARPLAVGWEHHVKDPLLRHDVAACVIGDPDRRLKSALVLAERLRSLPDRRIAANTAREIEAGRIRSIEIVRMGTRTALAAALAVIVSTVAITYLMWAAWMDSVLEMGLVQLHSKASGLAYEIRNSIEGVQSDALSLAVNPVVSDLCISSRDDDHEEASDLRLPNVVGNEVDLSQQIKEVIENALYADSGNRLYSHVTIVRLNETGDATRVFVMSPDDPEAAMPHDTVNDQQLIDACHALQTTSPSYVLWSIPASGMNDDVVEGNGLASLVAVAGVYGFDGNISGAVILELELSHVFASLNTGPYLHFVRNEMGQIIVHPDVKAPASDVRQDQSMWGSVDQELRGWQDLRKKRGVPFARILRPEGFGHGCRLCRLDLDIDGVRTWDEMRRKLTTLQDEYQGVLRLPRSDDITNDQPCIFIRGNLENADALRALDVVQAELESIPGVRLGWVTDCHWNYGAVARLDYDPSDPGRYIDVVIASSAGEMQSETFGRVSHYVLGGAVVIAVAMASLAFVCSYLIVQWSSRKGEEVGKQYNGKR